MKQAKTERLQVRLTPKDRAAIERAAERNGMLPSEYMRACTLAMMAVEFDRHSLALLGDALTSAIGELVRSGVQKKLVTAT